MISKDTDLSKVKAGHLDTVPRNQIGVSLVLWAAQNGSEYPGCRQWFSGAFTVLVGDSLEPVLAAGFLFADWDTPTCLVAVGVGSPAESVALSCPSSVGFESHLMRRSRTVF